MPTASQAYLALDILGVESAGKIQTLSLAQQVLADCLTTSGWTGRVEGACLEYGRPASEDPQAAIKVALFDRVAEMLNELPPSQRALDVDYLRKQLGLS